MPVAPLQRFTAWSFSRLQDYRQCPYKAKLKHLMKLKEPENEAMKRGSAIHLMAQEVVEGIRVECPPELATFHQEFSEVCQLKAKECEKQVAFTRNWFPTEWFGRDAWVRLVIDLMYVKDRILHIVDHKSGKCNEAHKEQLSLYALGGFLIYPEAERVDAHLWYVDQGVETSDTYLAEEVPLIKDAWEEKTAQMLSDTVFTPTPSRLCQWCAFSKDKGGPCIY